MGAMAEAPEVARPLCCSLFPLPFGDGIGVCCVLDFVAIVNGDSDIALGVCSSCRRFTFQKSSSTWVSVGPSMSFLRGLVSVSLQ